MRLRCQLRNRRRHIFARSKATQAARQRMRRWAHERGLDGHDNSDWFNCPKCGVQAILKEHYTTDRLESVLYRPHPLMHFLGMKPGEGGWRGSVVEGGSINDRRRRGMPLLWQERAAERGEWGRT